MRVPPPFPLSPCHPWCDPPRFTLGAGRGGGACGLHRLPSHSRLQGDSGTVTPARPPVHTSQRGGCEHNPVCCPVCMTPAPHLSHATLRMPSCMQDDECVAPERWGAGVVHAERTWGCAHTPCGRGTPRFAHGSARPHCTRMGAFRCEPCSMPAREWREGACRAGCVSASIITPPVLARTHTTVSRWRPTPQSGVMLAWMSGTQRGCAAPVSVPCWDTKEAPIYTQTGA